MIVPLFHVDAFTGRPFAGNPAALCLLPAWKEDGWLQAVAREMNLSETAFLVEEGGRRFGGFRGATAGRRLSAAQTNEAGGVMHRTPPAGCVTQE